MKPSGGQTIIHNRVGWVCFEMKKAGLIIQDQGIVSITDEGKGILEKKPDKISRKFLMTTPKYAQYWRKINDKGEEPPIHEQSPEDMIMAGYNDIKKDLRDSLLERISENSPQFFEDMVLKL